MIRPSGSSSFSQTTKEVTRLIREIVNRSDLSARAITLETTLLHGELGLDSIDQIQIAVRLKERFGVQLSADDLQANAVFRSLGTLVTFVHRESQRLAASR